MCAGLIQQHVTKMWFAYYDDMIDALPADRTDQPFSISVLPWGAGRGRTVSNADRPNPADKDLAISSISIPNKVTRDLLPATRLRQLIGDPFGRRMRGDPKPQDLPPAVGGPLLRAIYLATLVWPTSMPSLRSSPWILGAPHNGLAMLISRISRRISAGTTGRPERGRDFQRQYDLNPARCQRTTVSGFTIISALRALGTKRCSPTKIRRSMALKVSFFGRCRRWMLS